MEAPQTNGRGPYERENDDQIKKLWPAEGSGKGKGKGKKELSS